MFERFGRSGIDYVPFRLENSRLRFRGPQPDLSGPYCAFLGSTETYGKFIARPYPAQVEASLGLACANFGCLNAGVDLFLGDSALREVCARARVTVIAVMGAHNLSNRFYSVHPRRNDRFIRASAALKALFPGLDFTDFNFTRHLLTGLRDHAPEAFPAVVEEVQSAWLARMRQLLRGIPSRTILLNLAERPAPETDLPLGPEPLFVTGAMIDRLRPDVSQVVECRVCVPEGAARLHGMVFDRLEESAAQGMMPPALHEAAAKALIGPLRALAV
ncbi:hypothetical protein DDZ14_10660 [Maritimibacter sp. 55A14]|uniref:DUF6473 family protein n=1 Tax=Maritimibacter sp. 55A14 TaxID=2174844 RepID=UPI000D60C237|nr:DUF6473 family protein [Maritimibacter sp. 55A14]PWE32509.1 hypothetical protein DDZ14_10660 [Maritimibacter sp. 55A14]